MTPRLPALLLAIALLTGLVQRSAHAAPAPWVEVSSPHFTVVTDAGEKEGRRVAGQFEQMRSVFEKLFPTGGSAAAQITVVAPRNGEGFRALEPAAYLARGQLHLAGLFSSGSDGNYILLSLDTEGPHPYATIYHEYTHFLLRTDSAWLPLWLNEGLAEFYQNTDILGKDVEVGEPSPDDILYLRQSRMLPLTTLLSVDDKSPYYHDEQKGSVFYAQSWALTHYLMLTDHDKGLHRINDYAVALQQNPDPVAAAQKAFGDLNQLGRQLSGYVQQGSFKEFVMKATISTDTSAFTARPLSQAQADAIRAAVLVHDDRLNEAQALLDASIAADPKNPSAQETAGFLALRRNNIEAAAKSFTEAVALGSQSYLANYYYAVLNLQRNDASAQGVTVESSLRAAIRLNPSFAPAYDALATYYSRRHENFNEAHRLGMQAILLDPSNILYRMNAAGVLENAGDYDNALRVLEFAEQHVAKTPQDNAMLESSIGQIKRYQAEVAAQPHVQEQEQQAASASSVSSSGGTSITIVSKTSTAPVPSAPEPIPASLAKLAGLQPGAAPVFPAAIPAGAKTRTISGVLHNIKCYYPEVITLQVDGPGHSIMLYKNSFTQIEFSAANFNPKGELHPCLELEGLKARVQYAEMSANGADGQIVSILLSR